VTDIQNPAADGTAGGAPKNVPGQNTFRIPQPRRPKQAASSKPRRRIRPELWGTLRAAIAREYQCLPPDSPRVLPTLPRLRWLEPAGGTAAVGGG
jgi:hypothetical protein